jgi:diguanylate cyclase (GGDEF)-like protein
MVSSPGRNDERGRRLTVRRCALLLAAASLASALAVVLGDAYLWPLFLFPLVLAAVFFFELGGLLVTLWIGNYLVLYHSFGPPATPAVVREAVLGAALFLAAGLLLGNVQRRHHRQRAALAATTLTDRLTGLYNYGTFLDYLHNEVRKIDRYGGELTLVMLDLDHFKRFNDRNGHEAGNELLRAVGRVVRASVREADMAARYGGEEFAVLIRGSDGHGYELAERLRRAVQHVGVRGRGGETGTTLSAGVASYRGAGDETAFVERADRALYESKACGRNRVTVAAGGLAAEEQAAILSA